MRPYLKNRLSSYKINFKKLKKRQKDFNNVKSLSQSDKNYLKKNLGEFY